MNQHVSNFIGLVILQYPQPFRNKVLMGLGGFSLETLSDLGKEKAMGATVMLMRPPFHQSIILQTLYQPGDVTFITEHTLAEVAGGKARFVGNVHKGIVTRNRKIKPFQKEPISEIKEQE